MTNPIGAAHSAYSPQIQQTAEQQGTATVNLGGVPVSVNDAVQFVLMNRAGVLQKVGTDRTELAQMNLNAVKLARQMLAQMTDMRKCIDKDNPWGNDTMFATPELLDFMKYKVGIDPGVQGDAYVNITSDAAQKLPDFTKKALRKLNQPTLKKDVQDKLNKGEELDSKKAADDYNNLMQTGSITVALPGGSSTGDAGKSTKGDKKLTPVQRMMADAGKSSGTDSGDDWDSHKTTMGKHGDWHATAHASCVDGGTEFGRFKWKNFGTFQGKGTRFYGIDGANMFIHKDQLDKDKEEVNNYIDQLNDKNSLDMSKFKSVISSQQSAAEAVSSMSDKQNQGMQQVLRDF